VLSYDDVDVPDGRIEDRLRDEQDEHFFAARDGDARPGRAHSTP
jgi:hypothetical protein